jgi:nitronate monooxygenase
MKHPIIQGPFGNGLSSVELVAAVNKAGGLGSFGLAGFTPDRILDVASRIRALTDAPFALNLWVPLAGESVPTWEDVEKNPPPSFDAQVEALLEARPPVASFVFGIPPAPLVRELRRLDITTIGTATNVVEGEALDAAELDVIVASGSEAGGHRSSFLRSPAESLTTSALVRQLAGRLKAPVVAAGGIVDDRTTAAAMLLGAEGVQVGTAFLATHESGAPEAHKAALVAPGERSTVLTTAFTGRAARALVNGFVREIGAHEEDILPFPWQHLVTRPLRLAATAQGRPEWMSLWASQNVPLVARRPAAELMEMLVNDDARSFSHR